MKTIVMYGDTFWASKLVPVTSKYGHLVTSFGLSMMKPVYSLMDELIEANIVSKQKFTVDQDHWTLKMCLQAFYRRLFSR